MRFLIHCGWFQSLKLCFSIDLYSCMSFVFWVLRVSMEHVTDFIDPNIQCIFLQCNENMILGSGVSALLPLLPFDGLMDQVSTLGRLLLSQF